MTLKRRRQIHLTKALAGQRVEIREERDDRWLVTFVNFDLGHAEPLQSAHELNVSPVCPVRTATHLPGCAVVKLRAWLHHPQILGDLGVLAVRSPASGAAD